VGLHTYFVILIQFFKAKAFWGDFRGNLALIFCKYKIDKLVHVRSRETCRSSCRFSFPSGFHPRPLIRFHQLGLPRSVDNMASSHGGMQTESGNLPELMLCPRPSGGQPSSPADQVCISSEGLQTHVSHPDGLPGGVDRWVLQDARNHDVAGTANIVDHNCI
jgi:hypothetical protein